MTNNKEQKRPRRKHAVMALRTLVDLGVCPNAGFKSGGYAGPSFEDKQRLVGEPIPADTQKLEDPRPAIYFGNPTAERNRLKELFIEGRIPIPKGELINWGFDDPAIGKAEVIVEGFDPTVIFGKQWMAEAHEQALKDIDKPNINATFGKLPTGAGKTVLMQRLIEEQGVSAVSLSHMPQQLGRAWRPGNKPRLKWNATLGKWTYTAYSFASIQRVCGERERVAYFHFYYELNRLNK